MTCRNPVKQANEIVRLSDGTTTIDFQGAKIKVMPSGISLPPPLIQNKFVASPFVDGDRLASSRYSNRLIRITFFLTGRDSDDVKDSIRSIERLLNDARKRLLLGQGAEVFLEYQWGLETDESVQYDVLSGELILPSDFSFGLLWQANTIVDVELALICRPFGRFENQEIAQETLENSQSTFEIAISYLTGDDISLTLNNVNDRVAQTFTTVGAITAIKGAFKVWRGPNDTPGIATIELFATLAGEPTGAALATGTIDVDNVAEDGGEADWIVVTFGTPVALSATTMYALVISADGVAVIDTLDVRIDVNDGAYAGGNALESGDAGATWNPRANDDCVFAIYVAETGQENWQDITTTASFGDVPARLYQQLAQNNAAGTKKVWIAKRSGVRQEDNLWFEGEDAASFTNIVGGAHHLGAWDSLISAGSGEAMTRVRLEPQGGDIAADTDISRLNYTISTLPAGQFRVLIRCRVVTEDVNDFDHIGFGFGWSYGDRTKAPTNANGEIFTLDAENTVQILDLGVLDIPPIPQSEIATDNSLELRIYQTSINDILAQNEYYKWDIDYIFLLPIDEGVVIADSIAAADVIAMDGISDRGNVLILSAGGVIEDLADIVGAPFTLGRESTRIYVLRDDDKDMSFDSDITYQPQFLVV